MLDLICLASITCSYFETKTVVPLFEKETGSLQFIVDHQALCVVETLSLQMFLHFQQKTGVTTVDKNHTTHVAG